MIKRLEGLIEFAKQNNKKVLSVAVAEDKEVLSAINRAVELNIVDAILVGDKDKIIQISKQNKFDLGKIDIIDEKDKLKAAEIAVKLVSLGKAQYIMKGMINTADLLKAVLNKNAGLRENTILSHVMVYEVSTYHKLIFLTDGGMIPTPDLQDKIKIIKNVLKVTKAFGIKVPKIAPICASEVVNYSMQDTVDAKILTDMNKKDELKNCIIYGPLGLDNAISKEAAIHKGIKSDICGDIDVLLVPNMVSGNFLGKSIEYFAKGKNAGIIVGAKCPVVLVSRADRAEAKLYSIALGSIMCK